MARKRKSKAKAPDIFKKKQEQLRKCLKCGGEFVVRRFWQRFCHMRCKNAYHGEETQRAREAYRASTRPSGSLWPED